MVMRPEFNRHVGFRQTLWMIVLFLVGISASTASGQTKRTKIHGFWVAGSATVTVKADEALVVMMIRSSAPVLGESLVRNDQITQRVEQEMAHMGLEGKYRFSASHFNAGTASLTPQSFNPYNTLQPRQRPCGYAVTKYVFVSFDESDLSNPLFDQVLAGAIDALVKAGAQRLESTPPSETTRPTGPVWFSVKDPAPAQSEAIRQAADRARTLGEEVAKNSKVKITGIIEARVNRPFQVRLPRQQELDVRDEQNLKYYGTSRDAVTIPATFVVEYSAK
jgi:uncharacterized protein YggE